MGSPSREGSKPSNVDRWVYREELKHVNDWNFAFKIGL